MAIACGDHLAVATTSSTETTSTGTDTDTDTTTDTEATKSDLPPESAWCEAGVEVLESCSSDNSGFSCYDTPHPDVGVPMCLGLSSGPNLLELTPGMAACGCDSTNHLTLRDLDGDGADELIAACGSPNAVLVWPGRADGLLSCATIHPVDAAGHLWFVDFDEDGVEDLITSRGDTNELLRASEPGVFGGAELLKPSAVLPDPSYVNEMLDIDIDGDGRTELLVVRSDENYQPLPIVGWTSAAGELLLLPEPFGPLAARHLSRADIDGDGLDDLVGAHDQSWWMRGSLAGLGPAQPFDGGADHGWPMLGDVDGDGLDDLVLGSAPPRYKLGFGDGSFGPLSGLPQYIGAEPALVHDLDGDGKAEIVANAYSDGWSVWRSTTSGPSLDLQVDLELTMLFAGGDVDGDGRGDLVTATRLASSSNSQITRWRAGG